MAIEALRRKGINHLSAERWTPSQNILFSVHGGGIQGELPAMADHEMPKRHDIAGVLIVLSTCLIASVVLFLALYAFALSFPNPFLR
jgi:hypothetical protein